MIKGVLETVYLSVKFVAVFSLDGRDWDASRCPAATRPFEPRTQRSRPRATSLRSDRRY